MADVVSGLGRVNAGVQQWIESNKIAPLISQIWEDNFSCSFIAWEDFPTAGNVFQYDCFKERENSSTIVPVWDGTTVRGLVMEGKIRTTALKENLYQLIQTTLGEENSFEELTWRELKERVSKAPPQDRLAAVCAIWKAWGHLRNRFSTNRSVWDFREYYQEQSSGKGVAYRFVRSAEFIFSLKDIPNLGAFAVRDDTTVAVLVKDKERHKELAQVLSDKFKALEYPGLQFVVEEVFTFS